MAEVTLDRIRDGIDAYEGGRSGLKERQQLNIAINGSDKEFLEGAPRRASQ